jgi:hypothetical protein
MDGNVNGVSNTDTDTGGSGIGTGSSVAIGWNSRIGNLTILKGNVSGISTTGQSYGGSGIGVGAAQGQGGGIDVLTIVSANVRNGLRGFRDWYWVHSFEFFEFSDR